MSPRPFYRAGEFKPHPDDAKAVESLGRLRSSFRLTPRGRVYGVDNGHDFEDCHVDQLFLLPKLIEVTVVTHSNAPRFTDAGLLELMQHPTILAFGCSSEAITDFAFSMLPSGLRLRRLHLPSCSITDRGVEMISKLKKMLVLNLRHTLITNRCVNYLARLTELRTLSTRGTELSSESLAALKVGLPRCRWID